MRGGSFSGKGGSDWQNHPVALYNAGPINAEFQFDMRARCPSCGTGYQLRAGAVQPGQRMRFRCKRCDSNVVVTGSGQDKRATMQTRQARKGETGRYQMVPHTDLEDARGVPPPISAEAIPLAVEEPPPLADADFLPDVDNPPNLRPSEPVKRVTLSPATAVPPPPIPEETPRPEYLKPPLPKPKAPTGFVVQEASSNWPVEKVYLGIAVGLVVGLGLGAVVAASFLTGPSDYDTQEEAERVASKPVDAPKVTSVADNKTAGAADEPAETLVGTHSDRGRSADSAGSSDDAQEPDPGTQADALGAAVAANVPQADDGPEEHELRAGDMADIDGAAPPEKTPTPAPPKAASKRVKRDEPATKTAVKEPSRKRWKRRAKAVLKRCDKYHRKVYEMKKAVRRGAITGDGDPAKEMHALQSYLQGKGGVMMDEAMAEAKATFAEAQESRPNRDQKWFLRQMSVTCEKSGRYPPNP